MPTAEQWFNAMDAETTRFTEGRALHCPPDGCEYIDRFGLTPGVDHDIDGGIYPGSPFAEHMKVCAANGWPKPAAAPDKETDNR